MSVSAAHQPTFLPPASGLVVPGEPAAPVVPVAPVVPLAGGLRPLGLSEVRLVGGFWGDRQRVNASATIDHCDRWEQRIGWIDNFVAAAAGHVERRTGPRFADSDVYKLLEAMAWEVARSGDPRLDGRIEAVARIVEAAQQPDGYLSTRYGLPGAEPRYSDLAWGHELYCCGHLIQAGIARWRSGRTDGSDALVRVALRAADHVCATFGVDGIPAVCGHPQIEMALVELYRATGERRYLDQAKVFVDRRGRKTLPDIEFGRAYYQDDIPVRDTEVFRGHAVRALYLACGAVDVAVETGDDELFDAVVAQFDRTLARRTYLTGGMGSRHADEAFGEDFELPPDRSYSETCAGIASVMLAWRLLLRTGRSRYAEVIERALFNVVAASPSEHGTSFFYANTLHQRSPGAEADIAAVSPRAQLTGRAPWFEVSCCPTNVARTLASLAGYLASADAHGIQLHQLAACDIRTTLPAGEIALAVRTDYPAGGDLVVTVTRCPDVPVAISVRIPSWARGAATLDGVPVEGEVARIERTFRPGDSMRLVVPVTPRFTRPDGRIDAVRGCVAVERGPVVHCLESTDLPDGVDVCDIVVHVADPPVERDGRPIVRLTTATPSDRGWPYLPVAPGDDAGEGDDGPVERGATVDAVLTPLHAWAHRGPSTMRVWLPATDTGTGR
jgi:DUF1680 family protein